MCSTIIYAYYDANADQSNGSGFVTIGSLSELPDGEKAIAYGWAAISPKPSCC